MSHSEVHLFKESASVSGTPDRHFFHNNLHYREVLATLRYGIEARKGLILLSGDAGTGKSTLLRRLTEELDTGITCILESDSGVNFSDLLQLILRHLRGEGDASDPISMVDRCKAVLRSHRDRGHIVCLIIDNADHLDELSLEYLVETFFPANSAMSDSGNLLQVVLAGRPQVREKLLHPWLRPLNPHLGLVCHVEPLSERDVGPYVEDQLRASGFPETLLDPAATGRIFDYTSGNPRLISELCGRAVQLAEGPPARRITAQSIADAAQEIGLSEVWRSRKTKNVTKDFPKAPKERDEPYDFEVSEANTTDMLMQTFMQDSPRRRRWFAANGRWGNGVRVLLPLLLIVGAAAWIQRDVVSKHFGGRSEELKTVTEPSNFSSGDKPDSDPRAARSESANDPVVVPLPPVDLPGEKSGVVNNGSRNNIPPVEVEAQKSDEGSLPAAENEPLPEPKPVAKVPPQTKNDDDQSSRAEAPEVRSRAIEARIQKAIQNRAISGIEVSVINGTAVLEGRVASERQKQAAERAANSVGGVARVRNRIVVG